MSMRLSPGSPRASHPHRMASPLALALTTALTTIVAATLLFALEAPAFADDVTTEILGDADEFTSDEQALDHHWRRRCSAEGCPIDDDDVEEYRGCGGRRWRFGRARWHHRRGWLRGRLALGYATGVIGTRDTRPMRDRGLFARLRLSRRLSAEVEFGGSSPRHHHRDRWGGGVTPADGSVAVVDVEDGRRDFHVSGGLIARARPWARFSPYLSLSGGVNRVGYEDSETHLRQRYGEVGLGLSMRLGRRLRIEGDVRAGKRKVRDGQSDRLDITDDRPERYRRARLNAVIEF